MRHDERCAKCAVVKRRYQRGDIRRAELAGRVVSMAEAAALIRDEEWYRLCQEEDAAPSHPECEWCALLAEIVAKYP